MIDLQAIQNNVRLLLTKYPALRSLKTRKMAIYKYWQEFEWVSDAGITKRQWLSITNPETISRAIRKCQQLYPELRADPDGQIERYQQVEKFSEFYKPKTN
jgi:hypothetical protein